MYAEFFGLRREPFSIAPDASLLFMSERHREALAHLLYGVGGGGGFVLLTGEIGTGKTTVCRSFLEQVPDNCNVAYIFNPKLTVTELLQSVCEEFGIAVRQRDLLPPTVKDYIDPLNAFLLAEHAAGRNNLLIIDEAQNLAPDVLEQLRLLTNLETSERKLLQIVLIGQPELRELLARPELEQLAQRVIARYHLSALTEEETGQYIRHRLEMSGLKGPLPFEPRALRRIHALSRGIPRRINLLCDRALLGAYAGGQARVTRPIVDKAALEVFGEPAAAPRGRAVPLAAAGVVTAAAIAVAVWAVTRPPQPGERGLAAGQPAASAASAAASGASGAVAVAAASSAPAASAAAPPASAPAAAAPAPALYRDRDAAWRDLGKLWGADAGTGEPCAALQRQELNCFGREMSLALVRQLGRPGIVKLDAGTTQPSYALLTTLTADSATLQAEGTEQVVTLEALAARWSGEFSTLWRSPPGYEGPIAEGQGGPVVDWMSQRLARIARTTAPRGRQRLDAALKARLKAFQVAQGLPADGRPGSLTLMQIQRVAGSSEPRLRTEP